MKKRIRVVTEKIISRLGRYNLINDIANEDCVGVMSSSLGGSDYHLQGSPFGLKVIFFTKFPNILMIFFFIGVIKINPS